MGVESFLTDDHLVRCLQQGMTEALAILFDRHYRKVLSVAFKVLRNASDAEDVMQEVFLEVLLKAGQFEPARGSAITWILQHAYFKSLDRASASRRGSLNGEKIPARRFGWHGLEMFDCSRLVDEGMATLTERQRAAIRLVHYEGYRLREAAVALNESMANVQNHYYRGLHRLRRFLEHQTTAQQKAAAVSWIEASDVA
ncbi:MAG: RNA polymerase sigma factor [Bryobacteraceae bacterium]